MDSAEGCTGPVSISALLADEVDFNGRAGWSALQIAPFEASQKPDPPVGPVGTDFEPWSEQQSALESFGLHPRDAASLAPLVRSQRFEPEQVIRNAGSALTCCQFVRSGVVSITSSQEKGLELGTLRAPCFVGLAAPLGVGGTEAIYAMVARTGVECLSISSAALETLMVNSPRLRLALLRHAATTLDMVLRRAACHAVHGVEERIASWLIVNAETCGEPLRITHETLARLLGARRATVTNALHFLEGERAVYSYRSRLAIRDAERLARFSCGCHRPVLRRRITRQPGEPAS